MIWPHLFLLLCAAAQPLGAEVRRLSRCHHDIQYNLDNIFNDLTAWCRRIDTDQDTEQLAGDLATLKVTVDMLFQYLVNIPPADDTPLYAADVALYLQQTRSALYAVQASVAQLGLLTSAAPSTVVSTEAKHCLDQLLETTVRVYRAVAVPLHAYVDELSSKEVNSPAIASIVAGISQQLADIQRDVDVVVADRPAADRRSDRFRPQSSSAQPDISLSLQHLQLDRCSSAAAGFDIPALLRTSHSPPIDYARLYAAADWTDKFDDSAAARAVRKEQAEQANSTSFSTAALLTHGHPVVIYSQNNFAHQLHAYRDQLNARFRVFYARLDAVCAARDADACTAVREHLDSVQTALNTIVQYVSRLTVAVVHSKLCPLTCNTGLRSLVLLDRQLMLTGEAYVRQCDTRADGAQAADELYAILHAVSRLVELPLRSINGLMDYVDEVKGGLTDEGLGEQVERALRELVGSFGDVDAREAGGGPPRWEAAAVRAYVRSLDEVLKNFRTMPGDGDVTQQELHAIRQSVSRVLLRMQHIHRDAAVAPARIGVGGGRQPVQRHLQRAVEHLSKIDTQLNDLSAVDWMKGQGERCLGVADENGDRADRSSWHGSVAGNARDILGAMGAFHDTIAVTKSSSSSSSSSTVTTTMTSSTTCAAGF